MILFSREFEILNIQGKNNSVFFILLFRYFTIMKKLILLVFCIFLISCSKTKVSELQYKGHNWTVYVFKDGEPYDGNAWSEDGKSYKITVDCGLLKSIEYYSEDGDLFCVVEDEEKKFYNENGNQITREQARELYHEKYYYWKHNQQSAFRKLAKSRSIE